MNSIIKASVSSLHSPHHVHHDYAYMYILKFLTLKSESYCLPLLANLAYCSPSTLSFRSLLCGELTIIVHIKQLTRDDQSLLPFACILV